MREILEVPVGDLMWRSVVTVRPETPLADLERLMATYDYNGFPVVTDDGLLQGLVSRVDLFKLYLLPYQRFIPSLEEAWARSVSAIMTTGVIALYPSEPAIRAVALMVDHGLRTIPIVTDAEGGLQLAGIVTRRDMMPALRS